MNTKLAATYVQITRQEFEEWLDSNFRGKWKLKNTTKGVYTVELSDLVGVEISSSIGSDDAVLSVGNAAIHMRMVSLVNGSVLNKKAQGQSHFKRTEGWRQSLLKGFNNFKQAYLKSASFYDAIAKIKDREAYKRDMLEKIEKVEGWQNNAELAKLHVKVQNNGVLVDKEEKYIDNPRIEVKKQEVDENMLNKLRKLYAVARANHNEWLMKFTESIGKYYKLTGVITEKQMKVLEDNFGRYKIASSKLHKTLILIKLNGMPF